MGRSLTGKSYQPCVSGCVAAGIKRKVRCIVVLGEMTEEDIAQTFVPCGTYGFRAFFVAQVPFSATNAVLKDFRVRPVTQHPVVIIGFDDQCVRLGCHLQRFPGDTPGISHYHETESVKLDCISYCLRGIVRYLEPPGPYPSVDDF